MPEAPSGEPQYRIKGLSSGIVRAVREAEIAGADRRYLEFETLTLAPIDKRLIRSDLLHRDELQWLDRYHARVLAEIGPMVDGETLAWLEKATAPLPHDAKI